MNLSNPGFWGIIHLILVVWAVISIAQSKAEPFKKALWIVLVLVAPVVGFIIWLLLGPKAK